MPEITVLLDGYALRAAQGVMGFCSVLLIEGEKRTLVDYGHVGRRTVLIDALKRHGLTSADIDYTVLSHAHWDHAQNLDLFSKIPAFIDASERRYAHRPHRNDWATPAWTGAMLETHPNLAEVPDGYEIEPGVTIMSTPGHSPGSISVVVESANGVEVITGDALHTAQAALARRNSMVFWDEQEAARSIERVVEAADVIYPGHDRPFRILAGDRIDYLRPFELQLGGADPHSAGLSWDNAPRPGYVMPGIEEQDGTDIGKPKGAQD